MQIVIDIPKKTNERIRSIVGHGVYNFFDDEDRSMVVKAIYDGIVFPENHGRLIDAGRLEQCRIDYVLSGHSESVKDCTEFGMMLITAPTVLPATEVSE